VAAGVFLALAWRPGDEPARERAGALARAVDGAGGWSRAGASDRMRLWTAGGRPPPVRPLPLAAGFVVGELFAESGTVEAALAAAAEGRARDVPGLARALSGSLWGGYVALLHGPSPFGSEIFRDPSGSLDGFSWDLGGGVAVAASALAGLPRGLGPPRLALDWDRIAGFLAQPAAMASESLFAGLDAVSPGVLQPLGVERPHRLAVWRPAEFADRWEGGLDMARETLVRRVDECARALLGDRGRVLGEMSGGLDSAIVAGAVTETGLGDRVVQWLNYRGDRREADESRFARAVAERCGVALAVADREPACLDEATAMELADAPWPPLNGTDVVRDRHTAARLRDLGAEALLSGQGGDAVFFQMPSALVLADALCRDGLRALASGLPAELARRTGRSVWSVAREALAARRGAGPPLDPQALAGDELRRWARELAHPWEQAEGLSPARRLQVRAIASMQLFRGDSRRRRVADLVYPLLAQPVVELCLALPTPALAGGAQDRRLAREAFAARLPDCVLRRRSKGSLTSFATRMVAASVEFLRPFLMEGCLAEAGLLDRGRLESALDPEQMLVTTEADAVLNAMAVEAWVRHWQGRVPDAGQGRPRPA
jgi:asparagine synthase (glutamine-hydrolysing)